MHEMNWAKKNILFNNVINALNHVITCVNPIANHLCCPYIPVCMHWIIEITFSLLFLAKSGRKITQL